MRRPRSSMRSSRGVGSQRLNARWTASRRQRGGSGRSSLQRRTARCVEIRGDLKTGKSALETGWDFANGSHRKAFMRELAKKRPEEVWMARPCAAWSTMSALAEANESNEYRRRRRRERAKQKRDFLWFSREIYESERPRCATSWETEAWCGMTGCGAFVDQCARGPVALDSAG
eukprot:338027-Pyramimonas_sp.AAC.1